jgi:hypothetical protein
MGEMNICSAPSTLPYCCILRFQGLQNRHFNNLLPELHVASSEVHWVVKRAQSSALMQYDGPKRVNRSGSWNYWDMVPNRIAA